MGKKGKELRLKEREIIINLYNQQKSYSEIGKVMKRSLFTIRTVISNFKKNKNIDK